MLIAQTSVVEDILLDIDNQDLSALATVLQVGVDALSSIPGSGELISRAATAFEEIETAIFESKSFDEVVHGPDFFIYDIECGAVDDFDLLRDDLDAATAEFDMSLPSFRPGDSVLYFGDDDAMPYQRTSYPATIVNLYYQQNAFGVDCLHADLRIQTMRGTILHSQVPYSRVGTYKCFGLEPLRGSTTCPPLTLVRN